MKYGLKSSGLLYTGSVAWAKREAWVQNRNLLRDFIKANSGEAKEAFSTMHDLMTASENIVGKGFSTKATPGLLRPRNVAGVAGISLLGKLGLGRIAGLSGGE